MTTDLLLSQALEGFYMARRADGYSPETLKQYDWALSRWTKFIGDKKITEIAIDDARRFIVYLQTDYGNLSPVSIFHGWKAIRAFYKWLGSEFQIQNVMINLKKPPFQAAEITPLSNDDIEKLLQASVKIDHKEEKKQYARRAPQADRNRLLILFLLDTGVRVGELCRLNIDNVNMETCEVSIQPFRSSAKSKPRTVYIGRRVQKELWKYTLNREKQIKNDPLFLSAFGKRLSGDSVKHLLDRIAKRAEVKGVHPHIFRHTFAIQYLRNGGDIFTLQKLLGHSSLKMVQHYLNLAKTDMETAHRRASPVDNWRL